MMQRIQKVIPMPYNEEKLMNLMENDFPEVKKSIEDFFESDYWKTKITDFFIFMHAVFWGISIYSVDVKTGSVSRFSLI